MDIKQVKQELEGSEIPFNLHKNIQWLIGRVEELESHLSMFIAEYTEHVIDAVNNSEDMS